MHVLIINDDGPPSQQSSPYVHSFVHELQQAGVTVSVVLPHTQRSWIGKAHLVGKTVTPSYFRPGTLHTDDGTAHERPRTDGGEEWVLVDGTPASCAQIGIHHYFQEKGPIDLVVSGPNYGRNSTALFALSSGTIGGAMEAAVCGKRAIALSYAFQSRNHDPIVIKGASLMSVRIVKYLHENWTHGVDVYSINVPLQEGIDGPETKVLYTNMLQNYWSSGSSFQAVDVDDDVSPEEAESRIRNEEEKTNSTQRYTHQKFKWAPRFTDVYQSVEESPPGNDGWAVKEGYVSVTPLKANFMHFNDLVGKQIKLDNARNQTSPHSVLVDGLTSHGFDEAWANVDYEDTYAQPKIVEALKNRLPGIKFMDETPELPKRPQKLLEWSAYEKIDFESVLQKPETILCNSYVIRKALIRKHHLAMTIRHHVAKHPSSLLAHCFPQTNDFELDYAEFLDEALTEAYELQASLNENQDKPPSDRKWWIMKPGMSDRGQGIRLFSTEEELTRIFESFEGEESDDEDGDEDGGANDASTSVAASQLRHFIAQEYIHPPLLVNKRKFHIRTYVLSVGGLQVYVYKPMLALFAANEYSPPWQDSEDLSGHLTNTCLQTGEREGSVRLFWDLSETLGQNSLDTIWDRLCQVVAHTFEAAARGQRIHFQTLPNAFEIFGLDFMVDTDMNVFLLEANSFPDFKQTGEELSGIISKLFEEVVDIAVVPFISKTEVSIVGSPQMIKVLDIELGSW